MKTIARNTEVISVSLPKSVAKKLENERNIKGQSRSAYIASLIEQVAEEARWERIYKKGAKTAKAMAITSENDIDRILRSV